MLRTVGRIFLHYHRHFCSSKLTGEELAAMKSSAVSAAEMIKTITG